jgi:hypothetical protein
VSNGLMHWYYMYVVGLFCLYSRSLLPLCCYMYVSGMHTFGELMYACVYACTEREGRRERERERGET